MYSKELLEHLKSKVISKVCSINTFDFATLYTIPHEQPKSRLSGLISTFIVLSIEWLTKIQVCSRKVQHCIFVKDESDSANNYSDII